MNSNRTVLRMGMIYLIKNFVNGKGYVGQSILSMAKRWSLHRSAAKRNDDFAICRALRKYGENNFTMEVLEVALPEDLDALEIHYIKTLNTHVDNGRGYNCTAGGRGAIGGYSSGTRAKISAIQKSLWESQEKRIAWGEYMKEIFAANPQTAIRQRESRLRFLADHPEVMIKHAQGMIQYHADNPERAVEQSTMMTDRWSEEEFRARVIASHKGRHAANPELAEEHADYMTQRWADPKYRQEMVDKHVKFYSIPENRRQMGIACQSSRHVRSASGFRGVTKYRYGWLAQIKVCQKAIRLGTHRTPEAAAKAYDEAARMYFGAKAFQNFPED